MSDTPNTIDAMVEGFIQEFYGHGAPTSPAAVGSFVTGRIKKALEAALAAQPSEPVGWRDMLANAYAQGCMDTHKAWEDECPNRCINESHPEFGEAASDYAQSITTPSTPPDWMENLALEVAHAHTEKQFTAPEPQDMGKNPKILPRLANV